MNNNLVSILGNSKSILIMLPTDSDLDQIAAGLSLYLSLSKSKPVSIYSPSAMTVELNRLVGVDKVTQELGNKNLLIKFVDYNADDVEKVSYDVESGQFQLTISPRENAPAPTDNQIKHEYSGISADTVFIIGGLNESNFPAIAKQEFANANLIHIGRQKITLSSRMNFLSYSRVASSESELIYGLIRENQLFIDADIATNLLMGVESKAGENFKGEGITAETFYTYADLLQYGARRSANQADSPSNYPPGAIPQKVGPAQAMPSMSPQPQFSQPGSQPQTGMQPQIGLFGQTQSSTTVSQNQVTQPKNDKAAHPHVQNQPKDQPQTPVDQKQVTEKKDVTNGQPSEEKPPQEWLKQPKIYKGTSSN